MGGRNSLVAEILRGRNQAAPEVVHPDAIGSDPAYQRVFGIDQPPCESKPIGCFALLERMQDGWNAGCHFLSFLEEAAPDENLCPARLVQLLHHQCGGRSSLFPTL